jgi:hypothetical protein
VSSTGQTPKHRRDGQPDRPPRLDPDAERVRAGLRATEASGDHRLWRELVPRTVTPLRRP